MNTVKVKVLTDIPGYMAGQAVVVAVDPDGTPLERKWRRRFTDAKTDSCIEVVTATEPVLESGSEAAAKPKSKITGSKKQEKSQ